MTQQRASEPAPQAVPVRPGRGHLRPLPVEAVALRGALGERVRRSGSATLPHCVEHLETSGVLANLRGLLADDGERLQPERASGYVGLQFADTDLHKVLEAIGWEKARTGTTRWDDWLDDALCLLDAVQEDDGYLDSWGQRRPASERLREMRWSHELYTIGHLIQAAVALNRAGEPRLLSIARRAADLVVHRLSDARLTDGHPEIETALVELFRETGERRYLETAAHLLDVRGHGSLGEDHAGPYYFQDHLPVREAREAVGHAVRQLYLDAGCVDVAVETGDGELLAAATARWEDAHRTRTYVTGAMGSRHADESFGDAFELPPDRAYGETCAAIADLQLSWRLLLLTGESRYADAIETVLHNVLDAAVSEEGTSFFYSNPLQMRPDHRDEEGAPTHRLPWYSCACCPPNLARLHASLSGYVAATDDTGLTLAQYADAVIDVPAVGAVRVETAFPSDGTVRVTVPEVPAGWTLTLRCPAWLDRSARATIDADGREPDRRELPPSAGWWRLPLYGAGTVTVTLPLEPRSLVADPRVDAVRGAVAVRRGPVVYCAEGRDQAPSASALDALRVAPGTLRETTERVAHGMPVLEVDAVVQEDGTSDADPPYRAWPGEGGLASHPVRVRLVPYGYWGNRGVGPMRVWMSAT